MLNINDIKQYPVQCKPLKHDPLFTTTKYIGHIYTSHMSKPHAFVNNTLQSNLDLTNIIAEVSCLLPQLADFRNQFNNVVNQTGINVIRDSAGNMSTDVPTDLPYYVANKISTRIGIIDRLITTHGQEINELLQKGLNI